MRSLRLVLILGGVALLAVLALLVSGSHSPPAEPEPEGSASLAVPSGRRPAPSSTPRAERLGSKLEEGSRLLFNVPSVPGEVASAFAGAGEHGDFGRKRLAELCDAGAFCGACASDADCSKGTGCVVGSSGGKVTTSCLPSECATDADCPGGGSCRVLSLRGASSTLIGRCQPPGTAVANAPCSQIGSTPAVTCAAGLSCRFERCTPTCTGGAGCPAGQNCVDGACHTKCASDAACPNEESCIPIDEQTAVCRPSDTESCVAQPDACGDGYACVSRLNAYRAHFYCARPCSAAQACIGGFICAATVGYSAASSVCYRPCREQADCPEGRACLLVDQEQALFACVPEL